MEKFNLYKDIQARTNGEIYIGVVGPVRTGKSTFIKRFMELLVIPNMENVHSKERTKDELPQSAAGKTIMTTEPKFIPKEAAKVMLAEDAEVKVRLIDCVGYMVQGASGHMENEEERLVRTPWFDYEIPFTKAAEIGTRKVIADHSTIGIVVTTDGTFGELPRESYLEPEKRTIDELKVLGKPFIVVLNTLKPHSEETSKLAESISREHKVEVLPMNCEQLRKEDIYHILETVLNEFPVSMLEFFCPKWLEMLRTDHPIKADIIECIREVIQRIERIKDVKKDNFVVENQFINKIHIDSKDMAKGTIILKLDIDDKYYYEVIKDLTGENINNEYELISLIKELSAKKLEYSKFSDAINAVKFKGYGVVTPTREEISLDEPEVIKNGNKYGVKIKAEAPSIHMIKANIQTEIAPIVGSEDQAKDLIGFIKSNSKDSVDGMWETNIFGKSIEQIVDDGIKAKISKLSDETQQKMQDTLQKITNDSNGGVICIII